MHLARLEEAYANVIPARVSFLHDGWLVRITNGDGNNNNSVWPFGTGTLPVASKVDFLEQLYHERGHVARFRLTSFGDHEALTRELTIRGYIEDNPNWVMVRDNAGNPVVRKKSPHANLTFVSLDDWRIAVNAMNPEADIDDHWFRILSSIPVPHCFALIEQDGSPVSYGRALVQQDIVNLEELWTLPEHRSHGHGSTLLHGLLSFGREHGSERAFLAVNEDNQRATALYERFGFAKQYRYHYMVPPQVS